MSKIQRKKREMRKDALKRNPDYCRRKLSQVEGAKMCDLNKIEESSVVDMANQLGVV